MAKAAATTSGTLGLRVCGMQVSREGGKIDPPLGSNLRHAEFAAKAVVF